MPFHKLLKQKIVTKEEAKNRIVAQRSSGPLSVVFTNGCFDILHPGHVDYLSQARDLGDLLVLGLNTDNSIKRLNKAPNRPVNSEQARAMVLAALGCVDLIVLFDEETPRELISFLQPDVLVKGNDYKTEDIAGHDIVQAKGGKVITIPLLEGYSTTRLIEKILK
jgi:rfaE bifunctional protein nucleotidyltransferase chain/domain